MWPTRKGFQCNDRKINCCAKKTAKTFDAKCVVVIACALCLPYLDILLVMLIITRHLYWSIGQGCMTNGLDTR